GGPLERGQARRDEAAVAAGARPAGLEVPAPEEQERDAAEQHGGRCCQRAAARPAVRNRITSVASTGRTASTASASRTSIAAEMTPVASSAVEAGAGTGGSGGDIDCRSMTSSDHSAAAT